MGRLHLPVAFLYPEYRQSDLIQDFVEDDIFKTHLETMFPSSSSESAVAWDRNGTYKASCLDVYFEVSDDREAGQRPSLVFIKSSSTLLSALSDSRHLIKEGLPSFFILCSKSPFRDEFLINYDVIGVSAEEPV
jgi:hypothetical protein